MAAKNKNPSVGFDESPKVFQRDKINFDLHIRERSDFTDKQNKLISLILDKQTKVVFISGPAGVSKAQPLDADILSPNGWVKMGDIKVGDFVVGEDGKPHKILGVYPQGAKDVYKVSFSDGTSTECTSEHLWLTQTNKDRNYHRKVIGGKGKLYACPKPGNVKTTQEISETLLARNGSHLNHSIPICSVVNFDKKDHCLSPYILGALLGDGCFRIPSGIGFSSIDSEILQRVQNELPDDLILSYTSGCDYRIVRKVVKGPLDGNGVLNEIRRLGLDGLYSQEKFIPNEYLIDSVENRLALLQGLMDTDGCVDKRGYSSYFSTSSKRLADGVRFLVESLGGICTISIQKAGYKDSNGKFIECLDSYNVVVCLPPNICPFYLSRKVNLVVPKTKYKPIRYITNIERVSIKECQCILLDSESHLYLTNNFIVTHNTFLSIYCGLHLLNQRRMSELIYIRSLAESASKSMGYLPGDQASKLEPFLMPLMDKLEELLPKSEIDKLIKEERIKGMPINFVRGSSMAAKYICVEEAQNLDHKELTTAITRLGEFSKMIILGDPSQSDINGRTGFQPMMDVFDDAESRANGIHCFKFTREDIVRSGILKFIVEKIEENAIELKSTHHYQGVQKKPFVGGSRIDAITASWPE